MRYRTFANWETNHATLLYWDQEQKTRHEILVQRVLRLEHGYNGNGVYFRQLPNLYFGASITLAGGFALFFPSFELVFRDDKTIRPFL